MLLLKGALIRVWRREGHLKFCDAGMLSVVMPEDKKTVSVRIGRVSG